MAESLEEIYSREGDSELAKFVSKRLADLQVMGFNIMSNRPRKDTATGSMRLESSTDQIITGKIEQLVTATKVLVGRGKKIELHLEQQDPFIRERLERAIEKSGLLSKRRLPDPRAKGKMQKRPRRRRV